MARKPKKINTIGYEGLTVDAIMERLKEAGIDTLLDVRAVPLSRKPGFSKNRLSMHLQENGIEYVGLKGLGTPAEGRAAARKGQLSSLRRIFEKHMKTEEAVRDLAHAVKVSTSRKACLLCFEHAPSCCHRSIVAEKMKEKTGQEIEHLSVGPQYLL